MKRASEYRMQARKAMRGRYVGAICCILLPAVASVVYLMAMYFILLLMGLHIGFYNVGGMRGEMTLWYTIAAITIALAIAVNWLTSLGFFASEVRLVLCAADGEASGAPELFFGFRRLRVLAFLKVKLLQVLVWAAILLVGWAGAALMYLGALMPLFILLWYVVSQVLMLYFLLGWAMTDYILADGWSGGALGAMSESWRMMKGRRWKLFCLRLSFLGLLLLAFLSLGVGYLWVNPYILCAQARFYRDLQAETGLGRTYAESSEAF